MNSRMSLCLIATLLCITTLLAPVTGIARKRVAPCPTGWTMYDDEKPGSCLWVSASRKLFTAASKDCFDMNAHLMRIETDGKFKKFKELALTKDKGLWVPLMKLPTGLVWYSQGEHVPATYVPSGLTHSRLWYSEDHPYNRRGLIFRHPDSVYRRDQLGTLPYYVCEKQAECTDGWFGPNCDKECHCHGQKCDPTDLEVTCHYGCEVGWMGKDCTKRKEDAVIRYFCVNSKEQGQYVHLRVLTKGVHYDNIHTVDDNGYWISWCNDTVVHMDNKLSIITIEIVVNNNSIRDMNNGVCAGKMVRGGNYEWQLRIQEKEGVVSRNDQEVHIECNFNSGDRFQVSGEAEIARERWFRRSDIIRPKEFLNEMKETVELTVVDPSTGKSLPANMIGSTVVLKLSFGVTEGDVATGIIPYSCFASTSDFKKNVSLLDHNGCPCLTSPISAFQANGSNALVTQPFNLFGFQGSEDVEFHCSYILCFDNEPCPVGCYDHGLSEAGLPSRRKRRSAKVSDLKLMNAMGALPIKGIAKSPSSRRIEETQAKEDVK